MPPSMERKRSSVFLNRKQLVDIDLDIEAAAETIIIVLVSILNRTHQKDSKPLIERAGIGCHYLNLAH